MQGTARLREWLGRALLVCFGLVAALVLLELALQIGAAVVSATHGSRAATRDPGRFRIVCLGDSNTFGLYLLPEESYPAQLQKQLATLRPDREIEVLNLGAPGLNSSRLLRDVDSLLASLSPDLVIVMLGVNDFWTDPDAESAAPPATLRERLLRHSRVLRLARLLRARGRSDVEVAVPLGTGMDRADQWVRVGDRAFDFGFERMRVDLDAAEARITTNLLALRDQIVAAGAQPLFLTYPGRYEYYGRANRAIREAARQGLPLLDLTPAFRERCPLTKCPALLFDDQHPTAEGYRLVVRQIMAWLHRQP
jgi:lysophospholipase L1-like esterase